jgi:N-formylmaleamate deformylase
MAKPSVAVAIIDMQEDVVRGPWFNWWPDSARVLENCARLIAACRDHDVPVLYTAVEYKADGSNTPEAVATGKPVPYEFLIEGTPGASIAVEVRPAEGETVAIKNLISGFSAQGFEEALEALHVDVLVLAGIAIEFGVLSTAEDAKARGINLILVPECCAGVDEQSFERHVNEAYSPIARVLSLDQAIAAVASR